MNAGILPTEVGAWQVLFFFACGVIIIISVEYNQNLVIFANILHWDSLRKFFYYVHIHMQTEIHTYAVQATHGGKNRSS